MPTPRLIVFVSVARPSIRCATSSRGHPPISFVCFSPVRSTTSEPASRSLPLNCVFLYFVVTSTTFALRNPPHASTCFSVRPPYIVRTCQPRRVIVLSFLYRVVTPRQRVPNVVLPAPAYLNIRSDVSTPSSTNSPFSTEVPLSHTSPT